MTKTYEIEVDCANCANLMEQAAKKVAGVAEVSVNYMMLTMRVTFQEGFDVKEVMKNVLRVCRKVEPDCEIHF